MRLWCDGAHDAGENMRRDVALLNAMEHARDGTPVLRLFRFDPAAITLGHGQHPERELDGERCARDRVRWAIRPTGGRAIFHADEWTYSFCARIADREWGGTLAEAYVRLSALLLASLQHLGVPCMSAATVPRSSRQARPAAATTGPVSAPCFATTTRHEIVREGHKVVGSAQRRSATALLQQGSVLLSDQHLRLPDYLAVPDGERERVRTALRTASTHIGDIVGARAPLSIWADALAACAPFRERLDGADAFPLTA